MNFSSNNIFIAMIQNQLNQLVEWTIIRILTAHQSNANSESSDSSESQKKSDQDKFDEQELKSTFWSRNVDYFNSNFNTDFIKIHDNKQIYHNVFFFMNWVWVRTTLIDILAENLEFCLLNKTDWWYTEKLEHLSCLSLQNSVKEWCKTLKTKFCDSLSCILFMLEFLHYTINNIYCQKDSIDYIQNIVLHEKNISIVINNYLQALLTYNYINDELYLHLSSLNDKLIIENLIEAINAQKNIWFNIYT